MITFFVCGTRTLLNVKGMTKKYLKFLDIPKVVLFRKISTQKIMLA